MSSRCSLESPSPDPRVSILASKAPRRDKLGALFLLGNASLNIYAIATSNMEAAAHDVSCRDGSIGRASGSRLVFSRRQISWDRRSACAFPDPFRGRIRTLNPMPQGPDNGDAIGRHVDLLVILMAVIVVGLISVAIYRG